MDKLSREINLHPTFNKNADFICVEYPGIVSNINNALATLGGQEHIENVYNDPAKRLDLKFRPDDPCCKPLCADKTSSTSLLLRVCKYQRKKKTESGDSSENEFMYRQHICGVINTVYKFKSLCDYQYLPLRRDVKTGELRNMIPHLKVDELTLKDKSFFTKDVGLFLPPPVYGRLDKPYTYRYKKEHYNYRKKTVRQKTNWESKVSSRKGRGHYCVLVQYEAKAPVKCLPKAREVFESMYDVVNEATEKVKKAFEERPVWSRNALQGTVGISISTLKIVLPVFGYYVVSGPWARLWVRYGYDPKLDQAAKYYQLIDFRLRRGVHTPHIPIKAKRSTFNYKLPHLSSKRPANKTPAPFTLNQPQEAQSVDRASPPDSAYLYQPGILPAHRQIYYQVCDIKLPEVQRLVDKVASDASTTCTKEEGWLLPNTTAEIRNILTKDIYKTLTTMTCGSPHEAPKNLFAQGKTKQAKVSTDDYPSAQSELDPEESDPDEDLEGSSDSSDDEGLMNERSQEDILAEAFSLDADDEELPDDDDFDDGDDFLFEDEQMLDESSMFDEPDASKE